jgi:negative regulator of sigma E activity
MIEENHSYTLVGDFKEYVELESGANLIKEFNSGYNLIIKGKERLLNKDAYQIQVVYKDEFEFYLVQYPDDLGNLKWHLYNTSGEILHAGFDEIEIIESNYFKVRNGNQIQWLNRSSKAIYTIGSNESN